VSTIWLYRKDFPAEGAKYPLSPGEPGRVIHHNVAHPTWRSPLCRHDPQRHVAAEVYEIANKEFSAVRRKIEDSSVRARRLPGRRLSTSHRSLHKPPGAPVSLQEVEARPINLDSTPGLSPSCAGQGIHSEHSGLGWLRDPLEGKSCHEKNDETCQHEHCPLHRTGAPTI